MTAAARFSVAELTRRQLEILEFIRRHALDHGYPPTVREIGRRFGIKSPNGVEAHLKALERKGRIVRGDMKSRTITVTGAGGLRLLGLVAAGPAIEAEEMDDTLDLRALFGRQGMFLFRCPTTSPAHQVAAGDLLVLRKPGRGDAGRTVVATVGGEVGLYSYFPRRAGVWLAPAGTGEATDPGPDARVIGVLAGVLRKA